MNEKVSNDLSIDLKSLVESHNDPFVVIDKDYRILAVNKAYEKAFGSTDLEIVGRCCFQVSHRNEEPCDRKGEECPHKHVYEHNEPYVCAHVHCDGEHRMHQVRVSAFPLRSINGEMLMGESIEEVTPFTDKTGSERMVGESVPFIACLKQLNIAAGSDAPVLLQGETGTGKELAAEYIHKHSDRGEKPFQIVDSTVLTDNLFESEVFGHEKGSYTGSVGRKEGLFELAEGGTVFLDEIGDLPASQQAKLLRVLETGQFRRVGGNKTLNCDVRIVCATNHHLWESVQAGRFREDLYYRIACLNIRLPSLRERIDDVPLLAHNLIEGINRSMRCSYSLSSDVFEVLQSYHYPGNVRELRNILFIAATHSQNRKIDGDLIRSAMKNLPHCRDAGKTTQAGSRGQVPEPAANENPADTAAPPATTLKDVEAQYIEDLLTKYDGNRKRVAETLGVSERTIYRKLKKLGLK